MRKRRHSLCVDPAVSSASSACWAPLQRRIPWPRPGRRGGNTGGSLFADPATSGPAIDGGHRSDRCAGRPDRSTRMRFLLRLRDRPGVPQRLAGLGPERQSAESAAFAVRRRTCPCVQRESALRKVMIKIAVLGRCRSIRLCQHASIPGVLACRQCWHMGPNFFRNGAQKFADAGPGAIVARSAIAIAGAEIARIAENPDAALWWSAPLG